MNFCQASIGTTISVLNRVEAEGYEATNLLQGQRQHQDGCGQVGSRPGFLSASFCRPPITLRLQFPLPIEISHIVLGPKVGQQVSTAFLFHTEITTKPTRPGNSEAHQSDPVKVPTSKLEIGKEYINDVPMPSLLVFRNPRFILRPQFCNLPLGSFECHRNYPNSYQLKHPTYDSCERVIALEVTIQRVSGISVPAIGFLSVWGQPGRNAPRHQIQNLMECLFGSLLKGSKRETDSRESAEDEPPTSKKSRLETPSVAVPDEFQDPITFEIMLQPVRLPCGIAIDVKTLETYSKEEAVWGRPPNDPFTGVSFCESHRPISDTALKSRIDSFLTNNSNEPSFTTLPRVLGSGSETKSGFGSSRISHLRSIYNNHSSTKPSAAATASSTSSSSISSSESTGSVLSSQDFMNQEMARILSSTPYKSKTEMETAKELRKCLKCELRVASTESRSGVVFYSSSCEHVLLCRNCLMLADKSKETVCEHFQCGMTWRVSNLFRIFT